jgi:hypothetical protein
MSVKSKVLNAFEKVSGTLLNPYIEEWKNQGKKVLGYNCSFARACLEHLLQGR